MFIPRPGTLPPVSHGSEILLAGLSSGPLPREPVAVEQAPHGGQSVADPPLGLGHLEDPRGGPEVGGESIGESSPCQEVWEGGQGFARHEGRAAGSGDGVQGPRTAHLYRLLPLANRSRSDPRGDGPPRIRRGRNRGGCDQRPMPREGSPRI